LHILLLITTFYSKKNLKIRLFVVPQNTVNSVGYWLLKTDPDTYSYDDLELDKRTVWDGVRNNLALLNMRYMKKGDLAFIYHTGTEKQIVGLATVTSNPYPDPKVKNQRFLVIDVEAKARLNKCVTLAQAKERKEFRNFGLVRLSRLSVMPVDERIWKRIMLMAGF